MVNQANELVLTPPDRCIAFGNDLLDILRGKPIPDHKHWDEETQNCGSLRDLIAAFARKHFGDLKP